MPTHDNTNRGALFRNDDKADDKHADYRGEIDVNGTAYWLNAWLKTSKKGTRFMSLSIKPKRERSAAKASAGRPFDDSADIPF
jgi:hypothetical protein